MKKEQKSFPAYIEKADEVQGIVGAYTSVMGNIDYGDDIILNGAFTKTITERRAKIRVLDAHNSWSAMDAIGKVIDIREVDKNFLPEALLAKYPDATGALYVEIQFMLDDELSGGIFRRIRAGVIDEYSIGFEIISQEMKVLETDGGDRRIRVIKEIKLYEVSPVIFAMNDATMTVGAKGKTPNPKKAKGDKDSPIYPAKGAESCKGCRLYGKVNEEIGYCTHHKTATAAELLCDDYVAVTKRLLSEPLKESLNTWLSGQISELMEQGLLDEGDKERLETLSDTLLDGFILMLPTDISSREIPEPHVYTLPKSLPNEQEEVEPAEPNDKSSLTEALETKRLALIAQIQGRMTA